MVDDSGFFADSLGEKDFTSGSGWMVAVNHRFYARSLGDQAVQTATWSIWSTRWMWGRM